jgi:hypothetical protein
MTFLKNQILILIILISNSIYCQSNWISFDETYIEDYYLIDSFNIHYFENKAKKNSILKIDYNWEYQYLNLYPRIDSIYSCYGDTTITKKYDYNINKVDLSFYNCKPHNNLYAYTKNNQLLTTYSYNDGYCNFANFYLNNNLLRQIYFDTNKNVVQDVWYYNNKITRKSIKLIKGYETSIYNTEGKIVLYYEYDLDGTFNHGYTYDRNSDQITHVSSRKRTVRGQIKE